MHIIELTRRSDGITVGVVADHIVCFATETDESDNSTYTMVKTVTHSIDVEASEDYTTVKQALESAGA